MDLKKLVLRKKKAIAEHTGKSHAYAMYALNNMPQAKAKESILANTRTASPSLREDTKALNQAVVELIKRTNHFITIVANDTARKTAEGMLKLPTAADDILQSGKTIKVLYDELGKK